MSKTDHYAAEERRGKEGRRRSLVFPAAGLKMPAYAGNNNNGACDARGTPFFLVASLVIAGEWPAVVVPRVGQPTA